jgi:hypothetical protein
LPASAASFELAVGEHEEVAALVRGRQALQHAFLGELGTIAAAAGEQSADGGLELVGVGGDGERSDARIVERRQHVFRRLFVGAEPVVDDLDRLLLHARDDGAHAAGRVDRDRERRPHAEQQLQLLGRHRGLDIANELLGRFLGDRHGGAVEEIVGRKLAVGRVLVDALAEKSAGRAVGDAAVAALARRLDAEGRIFAAVVAAGQAAGNEIGAAVGAEKGRQTTRAIGARRGRHRQPADREAGAAEDAVG